MSRGQRRPSGSFGLQGFPGGRGLGGSPSFCELQAGALSSREHVGGVGCAGAGEAERADDACRLLPWLLGRAGAGALSSRSTACTLRWRSGSTSGRQGGEALRPGAPGLTLTPTSTLPENVLSVSLSLKRCPEVINLELAACVPARTAIQPFNRHFSVLCKIHIPQRAVRTLPVTCETILDGTRMILKFE